MREPKGWRSSLLRILTLLIGVCGPCAAEDTERERRHRKLDFMVGSWTTRASLDRGEEEKREMRGEAEIGWAVGDSWLRHELRADVPGRDEVHVSLMMNYTPPKEMYNMYMFDHFGGEAGVFYGDWNDDGAIELTAEFVEEDGSNNYQRLTLRPVSADEFRFSRAFSNDGEHYHFALEIVYTRRR